MTDSITDLLVAGSVCSLFFLTLQAIKVRSSPVLSKVPVPTPQHLLSLGLIFSRWHTLEPKVPDSSRS